MFDFVDPNSSAFEALKQFCHLIGEGRMEDQKEEIYYKILYHPTIPGALLLVHYDDMHKTVYIREAVEGCGGHLEDLPLVHSFSFFRGSRSIFPDVVEVGPRVDHHDVMSYVWREEDGSIIMKVPRDQYLRLKLLFDEKNPIPWEEK